MPNLTPNYKLKKPIKATENADIDVLNSNMDILDTEVKKISDKANTSEAEIVKMTNKGIKEYLGLLHLQNTSSIAPIELMVDTTKYSAIEFYIYIDQGGTSGSPRDKIQLTINNILVDSFNKAEYKATKVKYEAYLNNNSNGYIFNVFEFTPETNNMQPNPNFRMRNYILPKDRQSKIALFQTIKENYYFDAYVYVVGIY